MCNCRHQLQYHYRFRVLTRPTCFTLCTTVVVFLAGQDSYNAHYQKKRDELKAKGINLKRVHKAILAIPKSCDLKRTCSK